MCKPMRKETILSMRLGRFLRASRMRCESNIATSIAMRTSAIRCMSSTAKRSRSIRQLRESSQAGKGNPTSREFIFKHVQGISSSRMRSYRAAQALRLAESCWSVVRRLCLVVRQRFKATPFKMVRSMDNESTMSI